jgi:predicted kinase
MATEARDAFAADKDVVWDQTSTSVKPRAKKLRMAPAHYTKIAVVFKTPPSALHAKMLDRPGKTIPEYVMRSMIDNFVYPTVEEGFDKIVNAKLQGLEL